LKKITLFKNYRINWWMILSIVFLAFPFYTWVSFLITEYYAGKDFRSTEFKFLFPRYFRTAESIFFISSILSVLAIVFIIGWIGTWPRYFYIPMLLLLIAVLSFIYSFAQSL
jgi:uncharacterized membrane protein